MTTVQDLTKISDLFESRTIRTSDSTNCADSAVQGNWWRIDFLSFSIFKWMCSNCQLTMKLVGLIWILNFLISILIYFLIKTRKKTQINLKFAPESTCSLERRSGWWRPNSSNEITSENCEGKMNVSLVVSNQSLCNGHALQQKKKLFRKSLVYVV